MNTSAFIAGRIAFNKQQSFSRFIIRLAIAATTISVAAMLLTIAFTNGFQYAVAQKMFSFSGHIRVQHFEPNKVDIAEELPIAKNDTVLQVLRANQNIKTIQAFATKYAVIKGNESFEGVLLKGVEKNYDFSNLDGFLQNGRWLNFPDSGYSSEINLSSYTAKQLKLKVNDKVVTYFIQPDGSRRARPMTVAGIFKTGVEDYDKLNAIVDLRLIQRLNSWNENQIGGYEIFVKDYQRIDTVNSMIFEKLPNTWNSRTITEIYGNIFEWLNLQDNTVAIVLVIMTIVAVLNLITCLIILLLERTRMVGVLKAIGTSDWSIQKIFLYYGAVITVSGIIMGNCFGLLIYWLQQRYGFITLPEEAYFISKAAVKLEWWHIAVVNAGTFLVCFLILMVPTFIIKRIQPVRAIMFR
ncbi:MAG: ABC transporter permease [Bacteroidetes bacterium]|nr:ABC transporter permease [Bacteroidota bacterium]